MLRKKERERATTDNCNDSRNSSTTLSISRTRVSLLPTWNEWRRTKKRNEKNREERTNPPVFILTPYPWILTPDIYLPCTSRRKAQHALHVNIAIPIQMFIYVNRDFWWRNEDGEKGTCTADGTWTSTKVLHFLLCRLRWRSLSVYPSSSFSSSSFSRIEV